MIEMYVAYGSQTSKKFFGGLVGIVILQLWFTNCCR